MTTAAAAPPSTPPAEQPGAAKTLNALLHMPAQMEVSQIELIYRAEGNANLVLALPQFKKVLRLPKMISSSRRPLSPSPAQAQQNTSQPSTTTVPAGPEVQPSVSDPTQAASAKAGVLTMPDFMAYIEIMRRLLGNEFVCAADIVAIPKESDRFWINEHIRAHRPVARLDKEFVGPFGLLLPDVTQLPATFDVLLANIQAKDMNMDTDMDADICSSNQSSRSSGISRLGDTYAIEIKPKQGWLQLPSDVSDLFDLMPTGDGTMDTTSEPAKVRPTVHSMLNPDKCRCRYCSMQLVKLQTGKIKRLGNYCPLQLFSGEIMALIKHLLVACLLREYNNSEDAQSPCGSHSHVAGAAAFGESTFKRCGTKTKATETTEIGVANVDAAGQVKQKYQQKEVVEQQEEEESQKKAQLGDEFVKAVAGQPQRHGGARAAAAENTSQRYTKRCKIATTTSETTTERTTIAPTWLSTNVAMAAARTEMETEILATATATATPASTPHSHPNETQAQINKAEVFHLPKNCVLQKILHLQLLVKRHFHYMWQRGYAGHATPSYDALRQLLSCRQWDNVDELAAEQAYMLGATALDCSIMLTFQEICCPAKHNSALQPWLVAVRGRQFLTKLSVLDLDPKPDSHFHKFIKHTREIEKVLPSIKLIK
ncbi:inositol-pentakisphosphate 2-kinase isoform X2 [Drosophila virilis]|uniref:inositol-pentakisphosphate 2-kinase isoform X2 n=1 Tax=Drosophila virilis TaxID=7244 RepID=UPI001395F5C3|nr:inositol-pentakisphosphate 2-kinase isoform X2 [Drosophila virilis]